ncbi:MAG TPA: FAD-dependent oxidoreductase [Patescibacteria group bacterium]|nr:FAD-dependent oxidoreductase [Patescibacteria group bacterium]
MIQTVKLLEKETVANSTMAFHWEKPAGFEFTAGQFGDITIINPIETDEEGNIRAFSFASAPYEATLVMATRMRDTAFKRVLKDLPIGTEVKLDAPYGDFKLHKTETTPAVFVIGGIGITPVRSIIAEATHEHLPHKITLLYSNKTPADAAFTEDLEGFGKENPNFTFVPVYTSVSETEWNGERGDIHAGTLRKYVSDVAAPIYYLAGPGGMVKAMRHMLVETGANEDNIRTEEFSGY